MGIFSRYRPWAIAPDMADHWTKKFGDLAVQARVEGYLGASTRPCANGEGWDIDRVGLYLSDGFGGGYGGGRGG